MSVNYILKAEWLGVEPTACESEVQFFNHYFPQLSFLFVGLQGKY